MVVLVEGWLIELERQREGARERTSLVLQAPVTRLARPSRTSRPEAVTPVPCD